MRDYDVPGTLIGETVLCSACGSEMPIQYGYCGLCGCTL